MTTKGHDDMTTMNQAVKVAVVKHTVIQALETYLREAEEMEDPEVFKNTSAEERYADFLVWLKNTGGN